MQQKETSYCVPGQVHPHPLPGAAASTLLSATCMAPQESSWTSPLPEQRITVYKVDEKKQQPRIMQYLKECGEG